MNSKKRKKGESNNRKRERRRRAASRDVDIENGIRTEAGSRGGEEEGEGEGGEFFFSSLRRDRETLAAAFLFPLLPFFGTACSSVAPFSPTVPYLGDKNLDRLDVLLGGGHADSHESLEDLSIEVVLTENEEEKRG